LFTGLIADRGLLRAVAASGSGAELQIASAMATELSPGDSVAVNGVCLTATTVGDGVFEVQAVAETLSRSTLGSLAAGAVVNLEAPLRAGDRLGGHIVQGHVDGVGAITAIADEHPGRIVTIALGIELARYVVEKGSVAVDGISLTVSAVTDAGFSVALIPETLARTTLGTAVVGDRVNLEVDIMAKQLERLLEARQPKGFPGATD
jgi:riboflavin synthase